MNNGVLIIAALVGLYLWNNRDHAGDTSVLAIQHTNMPTVNTSPDPATANTTLPPAPSASSPVPDPVTTQPVTTQPVATTPIASQPPQTEPIYDDYPVQLPVISEPVKQPVKQPVFDDYPVLSVPVAETPVYNDEPIASMPVADAPVQSSPVTSTVSAESPPYGGLTIFSDPQIDPIFDRPLESTTIDVYELQ